MQSKIEGAGASIEAAHALVLNVLHYGSNGTYLTRPEHDQPMSTLQIEAGGIYRPG